MKNIILCVILLFPSISLSQEAWQLEINSNDISVYTRYDEQGKYKSFMANTVLNAKMEDVVTLLRDIDGYTSWLANTNKAEKLGEDQEGLFIYLETSIPWPYKNEDMIYKVKFIPSGENGLKIDLLGLPGYIPPVDGIDRMKKAGGYIELEALGSKTRVSYFLHSEPGGNIPLWFVNHKITELPYKTLTNLKQLLENRK